MEVLEVEGVRIAGIAACVPANAVANDAKVAAATGIASRRVASDGVSLLDLCFAAATRVIKDAHAKPEEFGAIFAVSFTQAERMPPLAAQAQARLGFPKAILAFDVMQACAGWLYGLYLAALLAHETGKKVLLLDGDKQSDFLDAHDATTMPLLSDGATATIVEREEAAEASTPPCPKPPWRFSFYTDGEKGGALRLENGSTIQMDGFGVFRFVATDVVAFLKRFMNQSASTLLEPAFFVPHQPNVYMVRQLAKALGLLDRTLVSADLLGNLASASVPATLAANAAKLSAASSPVRLLVSGFGGGLAISAGAITLEASVPLSLSEL